MIVGCGHIIWPGIKHIVLYIYLFYGIIYLTGFMWDDNGTPFWIIMWLLYMAVRNAGECE